LVLNSIAFIKLMYQTSSLEDLVKLHILSSTIFYSNNIMRIYFFERNNIMSLMVRIGQKVNQ